MTRTPTSPTPTSDTPSLSQTTSPPQITSPLKTTSPALPSDLPLRRTASLILILLLLLFSRPFTPGTWFLGHTELGSLFDSLVSPVIYIAGLYFQWCISGIKEPLFIHIPLPFGRPRVTLSEGRIVTGERDGIKWVYEPEKHWVYLAAEAALVAAMWATDDDVVYAGAVCVTFAGLWFIGWFCVPENTKRYWWEHVKEAWIWMAIREFLFAGLVSGGRRRRYRYY
jgi:hypothetical protein